MAKIRSISRHNFDELFAGYTLSLNNAEPSKSALKGYLCAQGIFHMLQLDWRKQAIQKLSDVAFLADFVASHEILIKPLSALRYLGLKDIRSCYQVLAEGLKSGLHPANPSPESCEEVADFFEKIGFYPEGIALAEQAYSQHQQKNGNSHSATQSSRIGLANLYFQNDQNKDAEALYLLELEIAEQKNESATERLAVMNNLAMVYKDGGQMSKAETLLLDCLQICEEHILEGDETHLRTLNNLAAYYVADEDYNKAESFMVLALKGCEETLGPEDPKTISTVNNLAHIYGEQERLEDALLLNQRALKSNIKVLGPSHPNTLASYNNLGGVHRDLENYDVAEELYLKALNGSERSLGPEHSATMTSVNNLALLYEELGRDDEAETLFLRDLRTSEKVLGPDHPETLLSANNLAGMYRDQERYDEAEPLLKRVLDAATEQLGPEEENVLNFRYKYATLLIELEHAEDALEYLRRNLELLQSYHEADHPLRALTHWSLAKCLRKLERPAEAAVERKACLEQELAETGTIDSDILFTVIWLAADLAAANDYKQAIDEVDAALAAADQIETPDPELETEMNKLRGYRKNLLKGLE